MLFRSQDSQRIESCGHCDTCDPSSTRKIGRPPGELLSSLPKASKTRRKKEKRSAVPEEELMAPLARERFSTLKEWRKKKARELDIAAFMVFSDKTLRDIAHKSPRSREELRKIYGIGEQKLEAFGPELLNELRSI